MSRFTIARALYESEYEALKLRTRIEALQEENARLRKQVSDIKKIKMGDHTDLLFGDVPHIFKRKGL